jgi:hypothetical protein
MPAQLAGNQSYTFSGNTLFLPYAQVRGLTGLPGSCGQGQGRTADLPLFRRTLIPGAARAGGSRGACIACAHAGKPRSPWLSHRICPCPAARTIGAPRTRPRPPAQPKRGKPRPARGEAPGSPGRPGCWELGRSSRTSGRSGCTWPPRANRRGRCRATPPRCAGSPPATCSARRGRPAGSRRTPATSSSGWCTCWAGTAAPTPASSSGRCGSSSSGAAEDDSPTR